MNPEQLSPFFPFCVSRSSLDFLTVLCMGGRRATLVLFGIYSTGRRGMPSFRRYGTGEVHIPDHLFHARGNGARVSVASGGFITFLFFWHFLSSTAPAWHCMGNFASLGIAYRMGFLVWLTDGWVGEARRFIEARAYHVRASIRH